MGLDIYMFEVDDFEKFMQYEHERSSSDEDYIDEEYKNKTDIEINSTKYPDHMFKIGYFRSSYNEGGINQVLDVIGIPTLYDIFSKNDENWNFIPDWEKARTVCKEAIEKLKDVMNGPMANFAITEISINPLRIPEVDSKKKAMEIFMKEHEKSSDRDFGKGGYSNMNGLFYPDGKQIHAIIMGTADFINSKVPTAYCVMKIDNRYEWYLQALEIVLETIEFVLLHPNRKNIGLAWSG